MVCLCSREGFLQVLTFPPTVQRHGHGLSVESKLYFLFSFLSRLVSDWWPVQVVSCLSIQDIWDCLTETESFNPIFPFFMWFILIDVANWGEKRKALQRADCVIHARIETLFKIRRTLPACVFVCACPCMCVWTALGLYYFKQQKTDGAEINSSQRQIGWLNRTCCGRIRLVQYETLSLSLSLRLQIRSSTLRSSSAPHLFHSEIESLVLNQMEE